MDQFVPVAGGGFALLMLVVGLAGGFYLRGLWLRKNPESLQRFLDKIKKV